jgi:hypothetical protein
LGNLQEISFDPCDMALPLSDKEALAEEEEEGESEEVSVINKDESKSSWLQQHVPDVACMVSTLDNGLDVDYLPHDLEIPSDNNEEYSSLEGVDEISYCSSVSIPPRAKKLG